MSWPTSGENPYTFAPTKGNVPSGTGLELLWGVRCKHILLEECSMASPQCLLHTSLQVW